MRTDNSPPDIRAIRLLLASIQTWFTNLEMAYEGKPFQTGRARCPLCNVYFLNYCRGCPVSDYTKQIDCGQTPYHAVKEAIQNTSTGSKEIIQATHAQVNFLLSLLPKEIKR